MNEDIQDPFADKVTAHNPEKMDYVHSKETPKQVDFVYVIQRLAEIEDEIKRRGIQELIDEGAELRKVLKDAMIAASTNVEYDETSNYEAVIVQRTKDAWDVDLFKSLLSKSQKKRYITEIADEVVIKAGFKTGDLSRGYLEAKGAVKKVSTSLALYVKERKADGTDSADNLD